MIEARDIKKTYRARGGMLSSDAVQALRGVSIAVREGQALALLGESGCGKTTLGRILAGLETFDSGELVYDGETLNTLSSKQRNGAFRKVQLIHQDPYAALNPVRTIGRILEDPLKLHAKQVGKSDAWVHERARELLTLVGLDPDEMLYKYPHNLSGGQRQRVVVARALTVEPKVLVADEAVSMIDVSLRLGILKLLNDLRARLNIAVIFITHDVAAARYVAHDGDICVIYRGEIFEFGKSDELIQSPVNPYTQSLLSAVPVLVGLEKPGPDRFTPVDPIEGVASDEGCLFRNRCPFATEYCAKDHPGLLSVEGMPRLSRCHYPAVRHVVATPLEADRVPS